MMSLDLISHSFLPEKSEDYALLVRTHLTGFSLAVIDLYNNSCIAIRSASEVEIAKEIKREPLLQLHYRHAYFMAGDIPFAVVSNKLFDAEQAALYLPLDTIQQRRAKIYYQTNNAFEVTVLMDGRRIWQSNKFSTDVSLVHPLSALMHLGSNYASATVIVDWQSDVLYVVAMHAGKLLLANTYECTTQEDIAYFLLLIYQQLHLDTEKDKLVICIDSKSVQTLIDLLQIYIRTVELVVPRQDTCWNSEFDTALYPQFALMLDGVNVKP